MQTAPYPPTNNFSPLLHVGRTNSCNTKACLVFVYFWNDSGPSKHDNMHLNLLSIFGKRNRSVAMNYQSFNRWKQEKLGNDWMEVFSFGDFTFEWNEFLNNLFLGENSRMSSNMIFKLSSFNDLPSSADTSPNACDDRGLEHSYSW